MAVLGAALCQPAFAAAPQTCDDLVWLPVAHASNMQALNSPAANKPSQTDSLAVKAEQAKLKAYLTCNAAILPSGAALNGWAAQVGASIPPQPAKTALATALVSGKNNEGVSISRNTLAQAAYLQRLAGSGKKMGGINQATSTWRLQQAKLWCDANDKSDDGSTLFPAKLPGLDEGVAKLNKQAIELAWKEASRWSTQALGFGCDTALKEWVK